MSGSWTLTAATHMPLNKTGVKQAVAVFYRNYPFYPRPERTIVLEIKHFGISSGIEFSKQVGHIIISHGHREAYLPTI